MRRIFVVTSARGRVQIGGRLPDYRKLLSAQLQEELAPFLKVNAGKGMASTYLPFPASGGEYREALERAALKVSAMKKVEASTPEEAMKGTRITYIYVMCPMAILGHIDLEWDVVL